MSLLPDGAVAPSFLDFRDSKDAGTLQDVYTKDVSVRIGVVVNVYAPDDARNQNQKSTEYDVETTASDGQALSAPTTYKNCVLSSQFGTPGDYTKWALRAEKRDRKTNKVDEPGSVVVLICPNGLSRAPVIIAAVPNADSPSDDPKEDGYFYKFVFNGTAVTINKDGEAVIKRNGPTNAKGEAADDNDAAKATTITLVKDGSIKITMGDDGKILELKNKDGDAKMTLGDGAKSAAVAESLKTLYENLKSYIEGAKVPTGMGPSGTIMAGSGPAPSWDDAIVSKTLKIPK